ncbi:MAG: HEPN domain-containing protein [Saprospiraceae bacterium]|nr:HEPN domain-containing protein [Saprospiraceae bacterium]
MEIQDKQEATRVRLEQAHQAIRDAELLLRNQSFSAAINRVYYGMFYAVLALAVFYGFKTSKHGQLIGWFNREFIKTGLLDQRLFDMLHDAFDLRTDADYELDPLPSSEQIAHLLADMKIFIAEIEVWLNRQFV